MLAAISTTQDEFDALYAVETGPDEQVVTSTARETDETAPASGPITDWSNVAFALAFSEAARRKFAQGG